MVKRPLGIACGVIAAFLFLMTRLHPGAGGDEEEIQRREVTVTGRVYKKETVNQAGGPVTVLYLKPDGRKGRPPDEFDLEERVMCYLVSGEPEPELGSTVRLKGKASGFERASNPGQFDAYSYYQISGISYRLNRATILAKTTKYNVIQEMLYRLRRKLSGLFSESLPEKEASMMQTMLLGEKGGMERELKELYQRNGIAHLLAISGLHVSMLGMGLYKLLRKLGMPMKMAAVFSAGLMLVYGAMTGFSVSAVRAIFMFSLNMLAVLAKRTYDMLTALALAAVLILVRQPLYLYHSGFVFSFGCVLGIGLLMPALKGEKKKASAGKRKGLLSAIAERVLTGRTADGQKDPDFDGQEKSRAEQAMYGIAERVQEGLAMAAITFPIYLWFYYQFPVYSVFLNLLVVPLMSLLMCAGLLLLFFQGVCPVLSPPFALLIRGVLGLYKRAGRFCEGLPGHLFTPGKPGVCQMALCLLLFLTVILLKKRLRMPVRWGAVLVALGVLLFHPRLDLEITFLDVGQGDCIFVREREGMCCLIDGGSSSVSSVGKYRMIPFLKSQGASRLEAVFVTHPDEDHCNGIRELMEQGRDQGIRIENLVLPDIAADARNEGYLSLEQTAEEQGIPVSYISRGQGLERGGLSLVCLHPLPEEFYGEANEYSVVLRVTYGNFSALLTGDVEGAGEKQLISCLDRENSGAPLTVLKAAHHGSKGSTPAEFLNSQRPLYTVISCGRDNSYGHPHSELLERLSDCGSDVRITCDSGAVTFRTDGRRVRISGFLEGQSG